MTDVLSRDIKFNKDRIVNRNKRVRTIERIWIYLFAVLPLVGFLVFSIVPIGISFIAMFADVDIYDLSNGIKWNDFQGFKYVFTPVGNETRTLDVNHYFVQSLFVTLWIASAQLVSLFIALTISILIAQHYKGSKAFQVMFFIPYICSSVAVALMWSWIFSNESFGILNTIFGQKIEWTKDTNLMTWTIVIATIWQAPGYGIVMYKAAMANVNNSLYEAAELDGASWFGRVIHVTIPSIAPTTFYLLMAGVLAGFMTFDMAVLLIPGEWTNPFGNGSMGITVVRLVYYLMEPDVISDVSQPFVSEAAIITWVLFIITAVLALVIMYFRARSMENE